MLSIINPSRDNLKYLKLSYESVRKYADRKDLEYLVADDYSTNDDTYSWCKETAKKDPNFKFMRNDSGKRLGHCVLFDELINNYSTNNIVLIWHSDMVASRGFDSEILSLIQPKHIVSLTRVEPPLHPPQLNVKVLRNFGFDPEDFQEENFINYTDSIKEKRYTTGVFAPWAIIKKEFQDIGGHDWPLLAPQSKEDSAFWARYKINGGNFIQTWNSFVYHFTCKGSRRNPFLTTKEKDSGEWSAQNTRSSRNYIRHFGHFVCHDDYMHPIVPPKYNIGFVVENCDLYLLYNLEPWCSTIYSDCKQMEIDTYIYREQQNTVYDLKNRVKKIDDIKNNDILISFDGGKLATHEFDIITNLSDILSNATETGKFLLDIFTVNIMNLKTYEHELVIANHDWR